MQIPKCVFLSINCLIVSFTELVHKVTSVLLGVLSELIFTLFSCQVVVVCQTQKIESRGSRVFLIFLNTYLPQKTQNEKYQLQNYLMYI